MNDLQRLMHATLDDLVTSGTERGAQVAVYRHGEPVVDAVAGVADPATGRPVTPGTVFYSYSTGKLATATVAHLLVERGLFGYDTPVVDLWPEFGAHGKQGITVRHVLTHTAGVPGIPAHITAPDLCDWEKMCAVVADLEPAWEPGTATAYHAYTFGYIVGEIARRTTGRPISQVLQEEVTGPLGIDDELYFGMPESEHHRLARLEDMEGSAEMLASMPDASPFFAIAPRAVAPTAELGNRSDILAADIPAGGKMSARAMARMLAALLGRVDGVRLLTPDRLRAAAAVAFSGKDRFFGNPATWSLGYALGLIGADQESTSHVLQYGGVGGSYAFADTRTGTTFAFTKNRLSPDFQSAERLVRIVTQKHP